MWALIITLIGIVVAILIIFMIVTAVTRKRDYLAHEKLDQEYTYRKEPHADQVAEMPNKLKGNEVTKG